MFGKSMLLTQLALIAGRVAERDVCDVNSRRSPQRLAQIAAEAVVRAAYNSRLIGGRTLNRDVYDMHDMLGASRLDFPSERFVCYWASAWSGHERRLHAGVIQLVARIVAVMIEPAARNAVFDFELHELQQASS